MGKQAKVCCAGERVTGKVKRIEDSDHRLPVFSELERAPAARSCQQVSWHVFDKETSGFLVLFDASCSISSLLPFDPAVTS